MDLAKFCAELKLLKTECGGPSFTALAKRLGYSKSRIHEIVEGRTKDLPDLDFVKGFVAACRDCAVAMDRTPRLSTDDKYWERLHGQAERALVNLAVEPRISPWTEVVRHSPLWDRVNGDGEKARELAVEIAGRLAERVQAARGLGDPWRDRTLAQRVAAQVEEVCLMADLTLMPFEASILVLAPLVHEAQWACSIAEMADLRPRDLRQTGELKRNDYERFLRGQQERRLVARAEEHGMRDREGAPMEIAWWLFHRWLAGRAVAADSVLTDLPGPRLHDILDRLVSLLRLSPADLRDPQRLDLKPVYQQHGVLRDVRERLMGLIFVVAHSCAIELITLPPTIVEHLGIPDPVRLDQLRATLDSAEWSLVPVGICLVAQCSHGAVYQALREHVTRTDSVLGAVHAVVMATGDNTLEPLRALPARASADEVVPRIGRDGKPAFVVPVVRFRLDETRVRELLMGKQLYRDRSLAIRELYQNALDACRYRKARYDYIEKKRGLSADWDGLIEFYQGVDPDGRHYLRCKDNGVGMGFAELHDVFSQAGMRFADRPEFLEEQARWREEGVPFFPNSRFGIGAMSYFMLADEIKVTTCRMDPRDGAPGRVLQVNIVGPGHLFQINEIEHDDPEPGTEVKLYLQDGAAAPSCVDVLWRLLGIAEFTTTAEHLDQFRRWEPFAFEPRDIEGGIDAEGVLVRCEPGPRGQVVWCSSGGGLLVDGLHTHTDETTGVLARDDADVSPLCGAIVNLVGRAVPALTVNRSYMVGSVAADVESLLVEALPGLVNSPRPFLTARWICSIAEDHPRVADLIVSRVISEDWQLVQPTGVLSSAVTGCLPDDDFLVSEHRNPEDSSLQDNYLLWRLIAHFWSDLLGDILPGGAVDGLLPALPSDAELINGCFNRGADLVLTAPGKLCAMADSLGMTPRAAAIRLSELGVGGFEPGRFPADRLSSADRCVLSGSLDSDPWLDMNVSVTPWHVVAAARHLGKSVDEVISVLESYGFDVSRAVALASRIDEADLVMVSVNNNKSSPWLDSAAPVPIGRVISVARLLNREVGQVAARLKEFGYEVPAVPELARDVDLLLLRGISAERWLAPGDIVPFRIVSAAMRAWKCEPEEAVSRYMDLGLIAVGVPELEVLCRHFRDGISAGKPVPISVLLRVADIQKMDPWVVAAELRNLGVEIPRRFFGDRVFDEVDRSLLGVGVVRERQRGRRYSRSKIYLDESVPLGHLIEASVRHLCGPREAAERLGLMGFSVPDLGAWPYPLAAADYKMLSRHGDGLHPWLDFGETIPLGHLLIISELVGVAPAEVSRRLDVLGFKVPQPEDLPARFSTTEISLLMDSRDVVVVPTEPLVMSKLIVMTMRTRRPMKELAEGLDALGVKVPDLEKELPELLAKVPRRATAP